MNLLGRDFHGWRSSWESRLEQEANGYEAEGDQFKEANPAPTFKTYLVTMTGQGWPMSGQRPKRHFA